MGNWDRNKLDLNGDLDYADTSEFNVAGTFNDVNEQTARGTWSPSYNAVGELTDNGASFGQARTFKWDAFGRLRQEWDKQIIPELVTQYRYNGLGERIGWQYDTDGDSAVETSNSNDDPWFYFLNDPRWRPVATITAVDNGSGLEAGEYLAKTDDDPKELYVFHVAGLSGTGASSYIDTVILRDADMNGNGGWGGASDGTLEQRAYYCQNWRADVVALLDENGARREGDRCFSYGMPFGLPRADCNADGIVDSTDASIISAANGYSVGNVNYDVRADLDLDGTVDSTDAAIQTADNGQTLGRGNLSRDPTLSGGIGSRIGYAGYQWDPAASTYHVRNRVLDPLTGRWMRRDPAGYVDGASLYEYASGRAISYVDASGQTVCCISCPNAPCTDGPQRGPSNPTPWQGGTDGGREGGNGTEETQCPPGTHPFNFMGMTVCVSDDGDDGSRNPDPEDPTDPDDDAGCSESEQVSRLFHFRGEDIEPAPDTYRSDFWATFGFADSYTAGLNTWTIAFAMFGTIEATNNDMILTMIGSGSRTSQQLFTANRTYSGMVQVRYEVDCHNGNMYIQQFGTDMYSDPNVDLLFGYRVDVFGHSDSPILSANVFAAGSFSESHNYSSATSFSYTVGGFGITYNGGGWIHATGTGTASSVSNFGLGAVRWKCACP